MGKASRRPRSTAGSAAGRPGKPGRSGKVAPAPYVARPFAGLGNEPDWVAIREILPAATAIVRLDPSVAGAGPADAATDAAEENASDEVTIATVLPMAWPGLHRADGTVLVATQSGSSSGDASRDLAAAVLATRALPAGTPLTQVPAVTADTPRLQDLLAPDQELEVTIHDGFEFWVGDGELDADAKASLERANASIVPTVRVRGADSAYHVAYGDRAFIRVVLAEDEDPATDALARLHAAGADALGEDTRLLGAFRACGALVPVIEVDPAAEPTAHEEALAAWSSRYAEAAASRTPLTSEERRARNGLLGRQVTLR
ncbi:MAG: DUF5926 family protein [Dermatophilaceae bacterium]